ncbi:hypothetical protein LTR08_004760 [Meristemomyces frigidus]|nr:hypothetical protein LTR08_004760 [Meristemomyces frigidus]
MTASTPNIESVLSGFPHLVRGPGGVAAVLKDGQVVGQSAWGYADLEQRIPMTAQTQFPICSISKQMVCLTMVSLERKPTSLMLERKQEPAEQFEAELRKLLPHLAQAEDGHQVTVANLYNMQSGIRDYWAMTALWGARPDGIFSLLHSAPEVLDRIKSFHFAPGTEYSYSNVNFHVLGRILENVSGISLAQLLVERLFIPAGMTTAALCPNTNGLPLPIVGYEGNEKVGYFAATNRIEWAGDAGIIASLDDMVAYEKYLDRSLSDPESLYARTSQQQTFKDGTPAAYGYGLARFPIAGKKAIGHGGALRGFRHARLQIPSERFSFVVMLNHENAKPEAMVTGVLGFEEPKPTVYAPHQSWTGNFLDYHTQLSVTIEIGDREKPGTLSISYGPGTSGESVKLTSETEGGAPNMKVRLDGDVLHVERVDDNRTLHATRIQPPNDVDSHRATSSDYTGTYRCDESDSTFNVSGEDGTLYGCFDGFLGQGPIWLMRRVGKDVWLLGNPRGLDSTPPGDWTVVFKRGKDGNKVDECTVGSWLARKVKYVKL